MSCHWLCDLLCLLQGSKPGKKHKLNYRQKCEIRDLVDLGDGYDETDTFIDNTEAVCIAVISRSKIIQFTSVHLRNI